MVLFSGIDQVHATRSSFEVMEPFIVLVDSLQLSPESSVPNGYRQLGIQLGLFHGNKPLCSTTGAILKKLPDENGVVQIGQNFVFEIPVCKLPRMAKLCFGIFEKKKGNLNPLFYVNTNIFDYKAKLKWKSTRKEKNQNLSEALF